LILCHKCKTPLQEILPFILPNWQEVELTHPAL
jgi:hypothetical protein